MSELARKRAIELEDECFSLRTRVADLEALLAEVDGVLATHQRLLDPSPRPSWPKGSILEKAVSRHEQRERERRAG